MELIGISAFAGAALSLSSVAVCYFTVAHYKTYSYELSKRRLMFYSFFLTVLTVYTAGCFTAGGYMLYAGLSGREAKLVALFMAAANTVLLLASVLHGRSVKAFTYKRRSDMLEIVRRLEEKDLYTKGHSVHVYKISCLIYEALPRSIKNRIRKITLMDAALFHDIGKIRMPLDIINKAGRLDEREYLIMTQHPRSGSDILENTQYSPICPYILYHHERMDGKGYYKLKGNNIPLEARIIAVADTFSALYSNRSYRKKMPFEKAVNVIEQAAGTQLDADIVGLFCNYVTQQKADALTPAAAAG